MSMNTTLLLIMKNDNILLAEKKRGFGKGKLNGIGGKVEVGETIKEAMLRETKEEIDVTPTKYEQAAIIEFDEFVKGKKENVIMSVFIATKFIGEPKETDEMKPIWFKIKDIPYDRMFPDDAFWLPKILAGKKIKAFFKFDEDFNILSHLITEVKENELSKI